MTKFISGAFALLLLCTSALAQDVRQVMFAEADAARAAAVAVDAAVLSPRNFERAQQAYEQAGRDLELNRNLERIRTGLAEAVEHFRAARRVAEQAATSLAPLIKTRNDAASVDAGLHDANAWQQAERRYNEAIVEFERGDAKFAERKAAEAEELYRRAELTAIKANYLNEARRLLIEADRARAERYAPRTFARATELLAEAERELTENRYDSDRPRDLARQAQYEARHALYLARVLEQSRRDRQEPEELILAGELPLRQIAGVADLNLAFDTGYEAPTARIIAYIEGLQAKNRELEQNLFERVSQVETLQAQLSSLESRYGGMDNERRELAAQVERQNRERERFQRLESMFAADQAEVLRAGNDVTLRLFGVSFRSGRATIEPAAFGLLTRVIDALRLFPDAPVRVEGHTDSYGGDAANMRLSRERADAVRAYLLANMAFDESRITAEGFGETRPVANNETSEGRARNRRIDIVIRQRR